MIPLGVSGDLPAATPQTKPAFRRARQESGKPALPAGGPPQPPSRPRRRISGGGGSVRGCVQQHPESCGGIEAVQVPQHDRAVL